MLKYNLIQENENEVLYEYFPEGGKHAGVIKFDKTKEEWHLEKPSKDDKHNRYALKMVKRLREFASNGTFENEGIVAWG